MRIAILSDIHANREAYTACLADARRRGFDLLVLLGDFIGYGPDPAFCLDAVMEEVSRGARAVLGNHDAAPVDGDTSMNDTAYRAMQWTDGQINADQVKFLADLPLTQSIEGALFVHASPVSPRAWNYVRSPRDAERAMLTVEAAFTFVGHTHVPAVFHMMPGRVPSLFAPVPNVNLPMATHGRKWLAVIGAVGQPRDGNPAACYAIFDAERHNLTYHRVPYDAAETARKIRAAGLPESLADRLVIGR